MFQDGFPNDLRDDVTFVVEKILHKTYQNNTTNVSEKTVQYFQDNKVIIFPYRTYFIEVSDDVIEQLNEQQKMILHCIYSRGCDGFVRQKHIYALLQMDYEDWAIPYIVKICDEYVVEILEMTYESLKEQDIERIKRFCFENMESFCKSYNRMISYWNEFYRSQHPVFQKYIGRKLFREYFGYSRSMESKVKEIRDSIPLH